MEVYNGSLEWKFRVEVESRRLEWRFTQKLTFSVDVGRQFRIKATL